jgi:hypothetical protein
MARLTETAVLMFKEYFHDTGGVRRYAHNLRQIDGDQPAWAINLKGANKAFPLESLHALGARTLTISDIDTSEVCFSFMFPSGDALEHRATSTADVEQFYQTFFPRSDVDPSTGLRLLITRIVRTGRGP